MFSAGIPAEGRGEPDLWRSLCPHRRWRCRVDTDVPPGATVAGISAKVLRIADAAEIARGFEDLALAHLTQVFDFSI